MKKIIITLLCLFLLCSCGKIEKIGIEEFQAVMEDYGLKITDTKDNYRDQNYYDYIEYSFVANSENKYVIEFFKATEEENMDILFSTLKEQAEATYKYGAYTSGNVDDINSTKFTIKNDDYYIYMRQVEDTLLSVTAKKDYKGDVEDIIDDLGY